MFKNLLAQQVLLAGFVRSVLAGLVAFGVDMSAGQTAAIIGVVGAGGAFLNAWLYGVKPS